MPPLHRTDPAAFLRQVEQLAKGGLGKGDIAEQLGIKTTATLAARLVRASQETGQPIPDLGRESAAPMKRVDTVEVRRRGRGDGFGVNIPQEPLEQMGVGVGDRLRVVATRGRIPLVRASDGAEPAESTLRVPRLVKRKERG